MIRWQAFVSGQIASSPFHKALLLVRIAGVLSKYNIFKSLAIMRNRKVLSNLDFASVIHPKDVAVVSRLNEIPGFKTLLQNTVQKFTESVTDVTYTGNGFEITAESCPQIYNQLVKDCKILGMDAVPLMSVLWGYLISSNSVGEQRFRILLASGAVDLLTPTELDFLIGHELGHYLQLSLRAYAIPHASGSCVFSHLQQCRFWCSQSFEVPLTGMVSHQSPKCRPGGIALLPRCPCRAECND